MPWYRGETLLHLLETVHIASDRNLIDFRFPVQYVNRPNLDFRGFCGTSPPASSARATRSWRCPREPAAA